MTTPTVRIDVLRRALERLGWAEVGSFRQAVQYWEPRLSSREMTIEEHRIVLPMREDASDAQDLIEDAALYLGQQFGREFDHAVQTVSLMMEQHLDEIEVRRDTQNTAGLIEWQLGNEAIDTTRLMLSAAAKASSARRKRFFNAESVISEEFLAQCYMGQTKVGSYVVTALTPAEASLSTSRSTKDPKKHPRIPARNVTETLAESLTAIHDAIAEVHSDGGRMDAFELAVVSGVSYELLAALEPLTERTESGISIAYIATAPVDGQTLRSPLEFSFTPEDGAVISKARRFFEESPLPQAARITGEVTLLKNSSSAAEHQIKLQSIVNGRGKVVTVSLSPDQYAKAVEAHGREMLFTVFGELEARPRGSVMESPEQVHIEGTPVSAIRPTKQTPSGPPPPPLFE